jgi:hypothetical protein
MAWDVRGIWETHRITPNADLPRSAGQQSQGAARVRNRPRRGKMKIGLSVAALALGCLSLDVAARGQGSRAPALDSMVAAERAFAAATKEIGVRNGFLTFFAGDAVALEPVADGSARVVSARGRIAAGPVPTLPLANVLTWSPYIGQVSGDGGLGWLTGPYENLDSSTGTVGRGIYFSVWRQQADGTWRVWLDQGITVSAPWLAPADFRAADAPGRPIADGLGDLEAQVASDAAAWGARLAPGVRLHRGGLQPVLGRSAVTEWRAQNWRTVRYQPARTELSAARDMAIVIGGYRSTTAAGEEHGIFARVWQVASDGRWLIVFETSKAG